MHVYKLIHIEVVCISIIHEKSYNNIIVAANSVDRNMKNVFSRRTRECNCILSFFFHPKNA